MPKPGAEPATVRAEVPVVVMNHLRKTVSDGVAHKIRTIAAGDSNAVGTPALPPFRGTIDGLTNRSARGGSNGRKGGESERGILFESLFGSDPAPRLLCGHGQHLQVSRQARRVERRIGRWQALCATCPCREENYWGRFPF